MSLDFDFKGIKDWDAVVSDPLDDTKISPVTDRIIWLTMLVDIGQINEGNVPEFFWRVRMLQRLDGPNIEFMSGEKVWLTEEDIREHIGLRTNVITIPRRKWLAKKLLDEKHPKLEQTHTARALYASIALRNAKERQADAQDE